MLYVRKVSFCSKLRSSSSNLENCKTISLSDKWGGKTFHREPRMRGRIEFLCWRWQLWIHNMLLAIFYLHCNVCSITKRERESEKIDQYIASLRVSKLFFVQRITMPAVNWNGSSIKRTCWLKVEMAEKGERATWNVKASSWHDLFFRRKCYCYWI